MRSVASLLHTRRAQHKRSVPSGAPRRASIPTRIFQVFHAGVVTAMGQLLLENQDLKQGMTSATNTSHVHVALPWLLHPQGVLSAEQRWQQSLESRPSLCGAAMHVLVRENMCPLEPTSTHLLLHHSQLLAGIFRPRLRLVSFLAEL